MFFKKARCKHQYLNIGKYYKEIFTEYRNCFDTIVVYQREKCNKCGVIKDIKISTESFLPELYKSRDKRKDSYIKHLRNNGIYTEIEISDKIPVDFDTETVLEHLDDYVKHKGVLYAREKGYENYIPVSVAKQIIRDRGLGEILEYMKSDNVIKDCSTCKNNVEFPPPHTCDICTCLDQEEDYEMWEAK